MIRSEEKEYDPPSSSSGMFKILTETDSIDLSTVSFGSDHYNICVHICSSESNGWMLSFLLLYPCGITLESNCKVLQSIFSTKSFRDSDDVDNSGPILGHGCHGIQNCLRQRLRRESLSYFLLYPTAWNIIAKFCSPFFWPRSFETIWSNFWGTGGTGDPKLPAAKA